MSISVAHLGPAGTNAETAALAYVKWLSQSGIESHLCSYSTIAQAIEASATGQAILAVVPVENSIEGSVTVTLDSLWRLDGLQVKHGLVLPIAHALVSYAEKLTEITKVYSHPQALAQCQKWLETFTPAALLIPTNSTTEALEYLKDRSVAAISSVRAAELYKLPVFNNLINDYADNFTRFWVIGKENLPFKMPDCSFTYSHTSLAFSVPKNVPGTLVKPLQIFADRGINLTRIESRPKKRTLGEYVFFMDLECNIKDDLVQAAIEELAIHTENMKLFGSYTIATLS
jgi:prephenate dehydratase